MILQSIRICWWNFKFHAKFEYPAKFEFPAKLDFSVRFSRCSQSAAPWTSERWTTPSWSGGSIHLVSVSWDPETKLFFRIRIKFGSPSDIYRYRTMFRKYFGSDIKYFIKIPICTSSIFNLYWSMIRTFLAAWRQICFLSCALPRFSFTTIQVRISLASNCFEWTSTCFQLTWCFFYWHQVGIVLWGTFKWVKIVIKRLKNRPQEPTWKAADNATLFLRLNMEWKENKLISIKMDFL